MNEVSPVRFGRFSARAPRAPAWMLAGVLAVSPTGVDNEHVADGLGGSVWTNEHDPVPFVQKCSTCLSGAMRAGTAHAPGSVLSGHRAKSFGDDWYNRIHFKPAPVELGGIVWPDALEVEVWNAWFVPRRLEAITGLGIDLIAAGQADPPLDFAALGARTYRFSASPASSPILKQEVVFVFDNGDAPVMVTVDRAVAWAWTPNWKEPVVERLEFATDVMQSEAMVEQRRGLRAAPRRAFSAAFTADGRGRQALDAALAVQGARAWVLPVWPDVQTLTLPAGAGSFALVCGPTAHAEFAPGGSAVLIGEPRAGEVVGIETEIVAIDTVGASGIMLSRPLTGHWPAGTRLYPARLARLAGEPTMQRQSDSLWTFEADFSVLEACDVAPAPPAAVYRKRPVLEMRPDETETLTRQYARLLTTLDSGLAATAQITDVGGQAMPVTAWRWWGLGQAERAALRGLVYWLAGRRRALWVPSWADDMNVLGMTPEGFAVAWAGRARQWQGATGRKDIRVALHDGTVFYRRVRGIVEVSHAVEEIVIDAAIPNLVAKDVAQVCWMSLSRAADDTVEIEHITDAHGVARAEIIFQGVRDDDFS